MTGVPSAAMAWSNTTASRANRVSSGAVSREYPYATVGTDTVHIVEQVGTRYRAGVGVIVNVEEAGFDGPFIVDVVPSTALVEWEGAE